ncbi:hypothetical protein [Gramella sp. MAR_2010_147]|uniref:hypothetical protein n=1 Tax=Gramella sp. MAR_2010_147 TaxID=1250205 RepID=UPI0008795F4D|nr:hypothetical protein [Gramella sp. MAR_2010_147]SDS40724.1 hypothetical protein SAMN04488553_2187 [Gramella sp. MAR_2010_147]
MDKSSLMIGMLLLIVFMFPILYVILKQKATESKIKKELDKIALKNGLKLDKFETFGHLSLGLDSSQKKLVIIDPKAIIDHEVIDLKKVSQVRLAKKILKQEFSKERIIHLGLEIVEKNSSKITEIIFYDEDDYESIDAEIRLHNAKEWDDLLQKSLAF